MTKLVRPDPRAPATLERVIALGRTISAPPDRSDVEEQRAQLLALTQQPSRPSRTRVVRVVLAIPLAAAAAIAIVHLSPSSRSAGPATQQAAPSFAPVSVAPPAPPSSPIRRAVVTASENAWYALASSQPDEVVQLHEGTLRVDVSHLDIGERFRIITGNAEIEVRGTSFQVAVTADRLVSVLVRDGRVEVRHRGMKPFTLLGGQRWDARGPQRPAKVAVVALSSQSSGATLTKTSTAPTEIVPTSDVAFQRGFSALQAGDLSLAIAELEKVVADPSASLIEDARFWLAVAYARSKRTRAAVDGFERFLAHHPRSVRRGQATAMLAWQMLELGDADRARALFTQALADSSPEVRLSASAGLAQLDRARAGSPSSP